MFGLFHYPFPPDIYADINDIKAVRDFYRQSVAAVGLGVIEIDVRMIDGSKAIRTIFKVAQHPFGRTYLGSLTFPFRDFSYVLKVQCEERGATGMRDTAISMKLMMSGEFTPGIGRSVGWLDDPYDPNEAGPMTRNKSERPEYDDVFPDHPLSRARALLDHLERTVILSETVKTQPSFS
jgi:hypothetical protein